MSIIQTCGSLCNINVCLVLAISSFLQYLTDSDSDKSSSDEGGEYIAVHVYR